MHPKGRNVARAQKQQDRGTYVFCQDTPSLTLSSSLHLPPPRSTFMDWLLGGLWPRGPDTWARSCNY